MEVFPEPDKPLVVYRQREGNAFAEEYLGIDHYTYRAVADEDSVIQQVDRKLILEDFRTDPMIAQRFVHCLAKRSFQLMANFERLGIKSAQDRVFHLLKTLALQYPQPLDLGGRIKSYSADLNLSPEAVYRALKKLEDAGRIKRKDGMIEIVSQTGRSVRNQYTPKGKE